MGLVTSCIPRQYLFLDEVALVGCGGRHFQRMRRLEGAGATLRREQDEENRLSRDTNK